MRKMRIELGQLPDPDLNPNKRHHYMKLARAKRDAREMAKALACEQVRPNPPFEKSHITITFIAQDRRGRDLDNCIAQTKSYIDGLRDAGIIVNDTADRVSYTFRYERGDKNNTIIKIEEVE